LPKQKKRDIGGWREKNTLLATATLYQSATVDEIQSFEVFFKRDFFITSTSAYFSMETFLKVSARPLNRRAPTIALEPAI
jgi:hypothetical protein